MCIRDRYACRPAADNRVVVIRSSYMGEGSEELGKVLIKGFILSLIHIFASAVAEGANEIGTVYYSDTFGYENQLDIIAVSYTHLDVYKRQALHL